MERVFKIQRKFVAYLLEHKKLIEFGRNSSRRGLRIPSVGILPRLEALPPSRAPLACSPAPSITPSSTSLVCSVWKHDVEQARKWVETLFVDFGKKSLLEFWLGVREIKDTLRFSKQITGECGKFSVMWPACPFESELDCPLISIFLRLKSVTITEQTYILNYILHAFR